MISPAYEPDAAGGERWAAFGIEWPPVERRIISPQDQAWPDFAPAAASA